MPDRAALARAEARVRNVFATEYGHRTPAGRRARRCRRLGGRDGDGPGRPVRPAAGGPGPGRRRGRPATALRAVDAAAASYAVKPLPTRWPTSTTLSRLPPAATAAADPRGLADAARNLAVGRFRCFVRGDWDGGLPLLAKGSDDALRAAAERDLARPTEPAAEAPAGSGWWDAADQAKGPARDRLRARAVYW